MNKNLGDIIYRFQKISFETWIAVEGTCSGLPAGSISVQIYAGICYGESKVGDCHFGWNSYTHAMVSETFMEREVIEF